MKSLSIAAAKISAVGIFTINQWGLDYTIQSINTYNRVIGIGGLKSKKNGLFVETRIKFDPSGPSDVMQRWSPKHNSI